MTDNVARARELISSDAMQWRIVSITVAGVNERCPEVMDPRMVMEVAEKYKEARLLLLQLADEVERLQGENDDLVATCKSRMDVIEQANKVADALRAENERLRAVLRSCPFRKYPGGYEVEVSAGNAWLKEKDSALAASERREGHHVPHDTVRDRDDESDSGHVTPPPEGGEKG